jgi:hypothetical protein
MEGKIGERVSSLLEVPLEEPTTKEPLRSIFAEMRWGRSPKLLGAVRRGADVSSFDAPRQKNRGQIAFAFIPKGWTGVLEFTRSRNVRGVLLFTRANEYRWV